MNAKFKVVELSPTLVRIYGPDGSEWEISVMITPTVVDWTGALNPDGMPLVRFESAMHMSTRLISPAPAPEPKRPPRTLVRLRDETEEKTDPGKKTDN